MIPDFKKFPYINGDCFQVKAKSRKTHLKRRPDSSKQMIECGYYEIFFNSIIISLTYLYTLDIEYPDSIWSQKNYKRKIMRNNSSSYFIKTNFWFIFNDEISEISLSNCFKKK